MVQWKYLLEALKKPEWEAAIALFIQAGILALQAKILRRHGETMEEHKAIAKTQADTADLIAKALRQQGEVMDEQFKFLRKADAKNERQIVFDLALDVRARVRSLSSTVSSLQPSNYTWEDKARVRDGFDRLGDTILPCQKALLTSIHLSKEEKDYFSRFVIEAGDLKLTNDIGKDVAEILALERKYKDFGDVLVKTAKTSVFDLG